MKKFQLPLLVLTLCAMLSVAWSNTGVDAYARGHSHGHSSRKILHLPVMIKPLIKNDITTTGTCSTNPLAPMSLGQATPSQTAPPDDSNMYVCMTSYGFDDNDNGTSQTGTAALAYPKSTNPSTLHEVATEGKGTYSDPITFAADLQYGINNSVFPVGSRIYVPFLQKYFILEDQCATCGDMTGPQSDLSKPQFHIDLWMGPSANSSDVNALATCEANITQENTIIVRPRSQNLIVDQTPLFQNNKCSAVIHNP